MAQYSGMWTLSQVSQAVKDLNWTGIPPSVVEYLIVAGGGGGNGGAIGGGGGGAGGLLAGYAGITSGVRSSSRSAAAMKCSSAPDREHSG
jgi:hypothetical protein